MSVEELKTAIEELTEAKHQTISLQNDIADLVEDVDTDAINDMPLLYRMEIKRVLEEDSHPMAREIRT